MIAPLLKGRFGYYAPRNATERAWARKQAAARAKQAARQAAWIEKNRWCANGCGKPAAFYEGGTPALRFGGCCSAACEEARRAAEGAA